MAGVKGKSGGVRQGAGRKPKPAVPVVAPAVKPIKDATPPDAEDAPESQASFDGVNDPLVFLRMAWTGQIDASPTQVRAAAAAMPFVHTRLGEGGKKEQRTKEAEKVAGRFSASSPPKLVAAGGRKV